MKLTHAGRVLTTLRAEQLASERSVRTAVLDSYTPSSSQPLLLPQVFTEFLCAQSSMCDECNRVPGFKTHKNFCPLTEMHAPQSEEIIGTKPSLRYI